jgi:ribulose-5-phosphate 4-epimerase/fuculose-1-phosphate aldolase
MNKSSAGNESGTKATDSQIVDLVDANHILFDRGVLDAFGHVSVRDSIDPSRFLLARNMAPALVGADDIQSFDLEGVTTDARPSYLEKFIHSEIYKTRPDVMSVVHSHSAAVIPFSVVDVPLRAISHMAGFLGVTTPVFEIRDSVGTASDLLISTGPLGKALAASLDDSPVLLMRGHGSVAVGSTVQQAVYRAVFTEINARMQAEALRLGSCNYLTTEEGKSTSTTNDAQIGRAWALWRIQADGQSIS